MDRIISYRLGPPGLITQLLPPTTRYADVAHADKHRPDPPGLRGYNCPGWYIGVAIRSSVIAIIFGRWEVSVILQKLPILQSEDISSKGFGDSRRKGERWRLVGGDGGGEGVGDVEGGEGGVVGVGDVDAKGAAGGGFPELGDVEGGVVAAAEVGRRVVAAVIKVGLGHFVGGGGIVDDERELTRLCGVGEIELHAYPASCTPEACEPNGVEVPAGKAFGAAAFEAAVGDAAACLHLNGAGGVGGASVGHGVSKKHAVARLGRGWDVACGGEHSWLVGVRTVDGKCGPLGRYGGDFRNVVECGEMHFVGI